MSGQKTAVLMSGQFRTFAFCLNTQHWHVYRRYPDLQFFVVMQNTPEAPAGVQLLKDRYGADRVHVRLIDDPTDLPAIHLSFGDYAPTVNAAPHERLLLQHWYQNEVLKFFQASGYQADVVIRMRADIYFSNFDHAFQQVPDAVHSPYWGRFGGINDRFAIMSGRATQHYFGVYPKIQKLLDIGCPFHPESLSKASLEDGGIASIDTLKTVFTTYRADGNHRYPEITPDDTVHMVSQR